MVDIQVRNLTKFFVIGENLLDNLSFEIQEGERVAILGRNGCGKTTLFNILTGQMDYDSGEVYVNPNKRLGLISQIPKFPAGYTVEDVLRTAYAGLMKLKARMERLEADMAGGATAEQLREVSHYPDKHLGQPHFLPSCTDAHALLAVNRARTVARQTELAAYAAFRDADGGVTRDDIIQGLNRLSSLLWILMCKCKGGHYAHA